MANLPEVPPWEEITLFDLLDQGVRLDFPTFPILACLRSPRS